MDAEPEFFLLYDLDLKAPACVLLQAVFGCGAHPPALKHFSSENWITHPTPGMRVVSGTEEHWKRVAEITRRKWGDKRPSEAAR
jgi:hypothetical protein